MSFTTRIKPLVQRLKPIACTFVAAGLCFALAACSGAGNSGASNSASTNSKVITVGASPSPHAEILNAISQELAAGGYELKVVEYSDYVQPNVALSEGDLDANFFQHKPYLDDYNTEKGTNLVSAAAIHFEPMGLYGGKTADLSNIPNGAKIAVPSDATNEARALLLLQAQGVIKLKDGAGLSATKADIAENPHNIDLVEVEAAAVPRTLQDSDFAVINGNYALSAGIDTSKALASEDSNSEAAQTYANILAIPSGDESSDKTKALVKALTSAAAKDFINSKYNGTVVPVF